MAILKLSQSDIDIIREEESNFIMDNAAKDKTIQRLRPSDDRRTINNDELTYNYIKDTIETIIPFANRNGTPLTLNLLASVLGYNKYTLSNHINESRSLNLNTAEAEWFDKINTLIKDTLSIGRADIESMQLQRRIDANSAAKAIKDIDLILQEDTPDKPSAVQVQLVDDL